MENVISLLVPVTFLIMLAVERLFPARPLPRVRGWLLRCFAFFVISGALNALLPALIAPRLEGRAVVNVAALGVVPAAAITLLLSELLGYGLHRLMHRVHFLWRWTHQMHHSAERLDAAGAFYFHPLDSTLFILTTTAAASLIGAGGAAAALAGYASFVAAAFQHLNVRTPRWLGYVLQRPEAHSVHHQRGLHAYNYGNFMLYDLLFGTFRNPEGFVATQGFWDGASAKVGAMLIGRDVDRPSATS
jgi:sterol desaturase/sphingolipid hydroxylase (fatty acid hydroxylase superfamily)